MVSEREIVESQIKPLTDRADWVAREPKEDAYSPNQMIAAHRAGIRRGVEGVFKLAQRQYEENMQVSASLAANVIDKLQELKLHPFDAKLRETAGDFFEVLITLPKKEFLSEKFLEIYNYTGELEEQQSSESFSIKFRFYGRSENSQIDISENKIFTDGFLYSLTVNNNNINESGTRPA